MSRTAQRRHFHHAPFLAEMPRSAMSRAENKRSYEVQVAEQLPTPAESPEPEDVASSIDYKLATRLQDGANDVGPNGNGSLSPGSAVSRSGANDEALLSDTSEQSRPVPQIRRPGDARRRSSVSEHEKVLKLSPKQFHELANEPTSIPVRTATPIPEDALEGGTQEEMGDAQVVSRALNDRLEVAGELNGTQEKRRNRSRTYDTSAAKEIVVTKGQVEDMKQKANRPSMNGRSATGPPAMRRKHSAQKHGQGYGFDSDEHRPAKPLPPPLNLDTKSSRESREPLKMPPQERHRDLTSPVANQLPLPPMSMPTFLSLELSAAQPSPLYIYRSATSDFPYESSKIKYERLVNFLLLPPKLESILGFGALACLDAWMHILTILPLRFLIAVSILVRWWGSTIVKEARDISKFVLSGLPRLWKRRRNQDAPTPVPSTPVEEEPSTKPSTATTTGRENGAAGMAFRFPDPKDLPAKRTRRRLRHRRTMSTPSALLPSHKADLLKGLLVISSCAVLMRFDASRMYHGIRGQSAIKLYVIYNVLEVFDRLLSALGQDVLECLFSRETLDRNPDGRSKVLRPFWMFLLALMYNVGHATALFYQVITLNVAVNSYSNALLTLLMSNQFVEIKGTVFKKFEKENLFQITCADIVERFQLWLMLLIIAMRNIVEVGGLSIRGGESWWPSGLGGGNATASAPLTKASILPMSFTIFPKWIAQVLNPFLLVLGSEMFVDWLKHAYITKFNQLKPNVYEKFLDVLAKDYYSDAFTDPNLTRRLGLPVLPLSCLFIRAAIQTYHMFIATHMPLPYPFPSTTSLTDTPTSSSPTTTAALAHIDQIFRRALGRSALPTPSSQPWYAPTSWTLDDLIAASTMLIVFLIAYLFFLAFKLLLGMFLLSLARERYKGMKEREKMGTDTGGKRLGGWGTVDVDEEKRRWIYADDEAGLRGLREREERGRAKEREERERGVSFGGVERYAMVAKRIW